MFPSTPRLALGLTGWLLATVGSAATAFGASGPGSTQPPSESVDAGPRSPPRSDEGPGPSSPAIDPEAATPLPDLSDELAGDPRTAPEAEALELRPTGRTGSSDEPGGVPSPGDAVPAPRVDPEALPPVVVVFGLGAEAPGTPQELAMLDRLAPTLARTTQPPVEATRLEGAGRSPRRVCRDLGADLVLEVGYLPDRADPVWLPYDCEFGQALGARPAQAADSPDWIGVLWEEHRALQAQGAQKARRGPNRRVRTALIAGGATIAVAGAVTLILLNVLRPTRTVLKVQPE